MTFIYPSSTSTLVFSLILVSVLAAFISGVYLANLRIRGPAFQRTSKVVAGTLAWLVLFSGIVESGVLQTAPMPGLPLLLLISNGLAVCLAFSPIGGWLATGLPITALVTFQSFRLPLELVLHTWVEQGSIPSTMTWTGQNLDILSGVLAILATPFVEKFKAIAWIFNVIGFALLLNVGRVAVLSSPLPFAWSVQPPLQLASYLPFAWIIPVCVGGALAGHIILTRALLNRKAPQFESHSGR